MTNIVKLPKPDQFAGENDKHNDSCGLINGTVFKTGKLPRKRMGILCRYVLTFLRRYQTSAVCQKCKLQLMQCKQVGEVEIEECINDL